jgi:two-component sensor histidine kinase
MQTEATKSRQSALSSERWRGILPIARPDGSLFRPLVLTGPIVSHGRIRGSLVTFLDAGDAADQEAIGEPGDAESKTAALMGEIHHGVRNNLQIISSLLSLQRGIIDDHHSVEVLYDIEARIQSMAIVHDLLYRSTSPHRLSFGEFLRELVRHLVDSLPNKKRHPTVNVSAEKVELHVGTAVPFGLLINEILTTLLRNDEHGAAVDLTLGEAEGVTVFEARRRLPTDNWSDRLDTVVRVSIEMAEAIADQLGAGVEWCAGGDVAVSVRLPVRRGETVGEARR